MMDTFIADAEEMLRTIRIFRLKAYEVIGEGGGEYRR